MNKEIQVVAIIPIGLMEGILQIIKRKKFDGKLLLIQEVLGHYMQRGVECERLHSEKRN